MNRLVDIFPGWATGAIFAAMQSPPWVYPGVDLDIQFFCEYGQRPVSPLLDNLTGGAVASAEITSTVARLLLLRYGESWTHKYALLNLEYNPIENYNSTETEELTRNTEGSGGENINRQRSDTDTGTTTETRDLATTNDETRNLSKSNDSANSDSVYGFNSGSAVPDTETSGTATESDTGTVAVTGSDTGTVTTQRNDTRAGTDTDTKTSTSKEDTTEARTTTRKGNIGVTTTQQMMQSEIELWRWNYLEDVFRDAARLLTIPIYE